MTAHLREQLAAALGGRYEIERELGQGGMAIVFRARDLKHDRDVAIKVLKPELANALGPDRFLREIKLTAQLSHPHILPLLDSGEAGGLIFYVMPFVAGESLRHRLQREGKLPLDEALRITREVADGLESAHRRGVIHRDVKPENILLEEGHAVVADFGIARAVAESADQRLTATGVAVGTPEYMSPEQMLGGRGSTIDARTDVFALGCVLHELLTGAPPERFTAPRKIPALPESVAAPLNRALSLEPEHRFAAVTEFVNALPHPEREAPRGVRRLLRPPLLAAVVIVLALVVMLPGMSRRKTERGRRQLARAIQLADSGKYVDAYAAFEQAERALPGDSDVARLMPKVADVLTVTSEPPGARVYVERYSDSTAAHPVAVLLGATPVRERRLPRGDYRVRIERDGFAPVVTPAMVHATRAQLSGFRPREVVVIDARLRPGDSVPPDMVFVPGGTYTLAGPKMPVNVSAQLDDYLLDRYEVSNEQYRTFVAGGGYRRGGLARLTDRSGMAGPRGWSGQEFPQDQGRYPVTGVSWLEASAYCASVGKRLPTIFEWEKAARNGVAAVGEGVIMPWGYVGPGDATAGRANFASNGAAPVDAYPFGISPWGAYNMAGNAKEWTANPVQNGYGVTGGSWEDPIYLYTAYGALPATGAAVSLGFRCARLVNRSLQHDQGTARILLESRTPHYPVLPPAAFAALLAHYRYDSRPLEAAFLDSVVTPDWTRIKLRFIALEGDTALAYLYLPKQAKPPFQTMVYQSSSAAFAQLRSVPEEVERMIGPNIRAGRAALAVVYKGMAERAWGPAWDPPVPSSVRFRDLMVLHATELRRGLDYLATRPDIDVHRLAYVALSWGAGSRLPLAAVDDRFRAVILMGGGIDERVSGPALPEASAPNFAPYIKPPKILINGGDDEEHPWLTRGLPLWNLLREPKQLLLVPGAGHNPPLEARVPAINQFLDKWLGPVRR